MEVSELMAKKRQLLLQSDDGNIVSAIFDPNKTNRSADGKYAELGGYFTDTTYGWHEIEKIARCVISVVKEFDPEPEEKKRKEKKRKWFW